VPRKGSKLRKSAIGHITCPTCDHVDAEVKEDKNGHAFIFCPDCNQQLFTRGDHRDAKLRKKMRPVTVTDTAPPELPVPPVPVSDTKPKETVNPAPVKKTAPVPAPAPAKKAGWLTPLLSAQGGK
jgi:hypothetical protein